MGDYLYHLQKQLFLTDSSIANLTPLPRTEERLSDLDGRKCDKKTSLGELIAALWLTFYLAIKAQIHPNAPYFTAGKFLFELTNYQWEKAVFVNDGGNPPSVWKVMVQFFSNFSAD